MSRVPETVKHVLIDSQSNIISGDDLEVIREEQVSQATFSVRMIPSKGTSEELKKDFMQCTCKKHDEGIKGQQITPEELESMLNEKEKELRAEYDKILAREMAAVRQKFDFILVNEQMRTSLMLQEAHRDRQEKIRVLQNQLQCKNLAALMYVMCTEKRRCKLEKLRIIKEYSNYIHTLQDILTEGQELILHLSRGYKTAARVDQEWREKMKKIVKEFLTFIYQFGGSSPELNQYFLDLPKIMQIKSPIADNPVEDPCEVEEEEVEGEGEEEEEMEQSDVKPAAKKPWWERMEEDRRPFVMYGDMADFNPPQRRVVLKATKAAKTAPVKWREYVFNDMFLKATCENVGKIKDIYPGRLATPSKWECEQNKEQPQAEPDFDIHSVSRQSLNMTRIITGQSIDIHSTMSSMLKLITNNNRGRVSTKSALLGARDSMEISSTTRLRERNTSKTPDDDHPEPKEVVLNIGKKRLSVFEGGPGYATEEEKDSPQTYSTPDDDEEKVGAESIGSFGSQALDSIEAIHHNHVPDVDHKLPYERICPMDKCQELQVDSFIRSLPPYMRASPFIHFEQTCDQYETCSPEQLEMLKQRIESKKNKESVKIDVSTDSSTSESVNEWEGRGVAVQTSDMSMSLPPCDCHVPNPSPVSSNLVFDFQDLIPVKLAMDAIHRECFYDNRIDFDRFKVIGQDSKDSIKEEPKKVFEQVNCREVQEILKLHPSLLDIFQANAR